MHPEWAVSKAVANQCLQKCNLTLINFIVRVKEENADKSFKSMERKKLICRKLINLLLRCVFSVFWWSTACLKKLTCWKEKTVSIAVLFLYAEVSVNYLYLFSSFSKDLKYTEIIQKKIKRRKKGIRRNCRR